MWSNEQYPMGIHSKLSALVTIVGVSIGTLSCAGNTEASVPAHEAFLTAVSQVCGLIPPQPEFLRLVDDGYLAFDPASADACLGWLKRYGCPGAGTGSVLRPISEQAFPDPCRGSLRGHSQIGDACQHTLDCVSGAFCYGSQCVKYLPAGSLCKSTDVCEAGASTIPVCENVNGQSVCGTATGTERRSQRGEACALISSEAGFLFLACASDLVCAPPIGGVCEPR